MGIPSRQDQSLPRVPDKHFVFVGGVHRSGTSLLHETLRTHPEVSGFRNTGKPKDEGQHLQSVFPAAKQFGGPGRFAFDPRSYMDETHELATPVNARKIFADWSRHWDLKKQHLLEKSPPTIVRTRYFQHLFPNSSFVIVLRHPIPVACATLKMCPTSVFSLIEHTLRCYERLLADRERIANLFVCRYESFVANPQQLLARLHAFLGLAEHESPVEIDLQSNQRYFTRWQRDIDSFATRRATTPQAFHDAFEDRMSAFGYRVDSADHFNSVSWIDADIAQGHESS